MLFQRLVCYSLLALSAADCACAAGMESRPAERQITVTRRYLNLPVQTGGPKRRLSLLVDGQTAREFEIELADGRADFWVFLDLAPFQGKQATLRTDSLPADSSALNAIEQGDEIAGAEALYTEKLRPQFHFSSQRGWNNDPNGLVYYRGEYHLFYQHNPYGWNWGNMHWGHAVSPDLVHWRELPIAIYPRTFGDWVFSGSAAIDWKNSAGFKSGKKPPLVAAYTSTGRGECIAFSNDRGRTFTDYGGNPVVRHQGRDPRIFWHAPSRHWVMAVYDEDPGQPDKQQQQGIAFYNSPDLKHWERQSRVGGFFECPDLFELPVDGHWKNTRWVLTAASSEYMVGQFDGRTFRPETPKLPGHRGAGFYAAQTYNDMPRGDGRRIQIGWGQYATPGMPFNQMMTFPCELTLKTTTDGIRLCFEPVHELAKLHTRQHSWRKLALKPGENPLAAVRGELFDIRLELAPTQATAIGLSIRGVGITYKAANDQLTTGNITNALPSLAGSVRLQILADRTSLEVFGNDGRLYVPMPAAYRPEANSLKLTTAGEPTVIRSLTVYELNPIWASGRPGHSPKL